jgi:hypothetical protein
VLGGSILRNDLGYLDRMYAAGAKGYFDALALHPYTRGQAPGVTVAGEGWFSFPLAITQMKQRMVANGDTTKTIWITEMGWPTTKADDATRATYLKELVSMVRNFPYVKVLAVYTLNDADYPTYGLIGADGVPSASWNAYSQAVKAPVAGSELSVRIVIAAAGARTPAGATRAQAIVTVVDRTGKVVPGVTVSGAWSGAYSGAMTVTTNSKGVASMVTPYSVTKSNATYTFKLNSVQMTARGWDRVAWSSGVIVR